jgi:hypothetical protein
MPFARTPEAEAERWLRVLRLHGEAGAALQALGVSEGTLGGPAEGSAREQADSDGAADRDAVAEVARAAVRIAAGRGVEGVATTDVLMAVMEVYGEDFDHVLRAHGTDSNAVLQQLGDLPAAT